MQLCMCTNFVDAYKAENPWKLFGDIVSINTDVDNVFSNTITINNNGNTIFVSGVDEGTPITVYDTSGKIVGSALTFLNYTSIVTPLRHGAIAIIKIGDMSVRTILK